VLGEDSVPARGTCAGRDRCVSGEGSARARETACPRKVDASREGSIPSGKRVWRQRRICAGEEESVPAGKGLCLLTVAGATKF